VGNCPYFLLLHNISLVKFLNVLNLSIIAGDKFTETKIIHLCKADVYMYADVISDVIFMPFGVKMCKSVCDGYQESMNIDVTVNVSLINSNCDYTGSTTIVEHLANCTHLAKCPDLSIACVCYYNVRCDRRTKSITYTFTPNRKGYLRVMVTDSGTPKYITWFPSPAQPKDV